MESKNQHLVCVFCHARFSLGDKLLEHIGIHTGNFPEIDLCQSTDDEKDEEKKEMDVSKAGESVDDHAIDGTLETQHGTEEGSKVASLVFDQNCNQVNRIEGSNDDFYCCRKNESDVNVQSNPIVDQSDSPSQSMVLASNVGDTLHIHPHKSKTSNELLGLSTTSVNQSNGPLLTGSVESVVYNESIEHQSSKTSDNTDQSTTAVDQSDDLPQTMLLESDIYQQSMERLPNDTMNNTSSLLHSHDETGNLTVYGVKRQLLKQFESTPPSQQAPDDNLPKIVSIQGKFNAEDYDAGPKLVPSQLSRSLITAGTTAVLSLGGISVETGMKPQCSTGLTAVLTSDGISMESERQTIMPTMKPPCNAGSSAVLTSDGISVKPGWPGDLPIMTPQVIAGTAAVLTPEGISVESGYPVVLPTRKPKYNAGSTGVLTSEGIRIQPDLPTMSRKAVLPTLTSSIGFPTLTPSIGNVISVSQSTHGTRPVPSVTNIVTPVFASQPIQGLPTLTSSIRNGIFVSQPSLGILPEIPIVTSVGGLLTNSQPVGVLPNLCRPYGGLPTIIQPIESLQRLSQSAGSLLTASQYSGYSPTVTQSRGGLPTVTQSRGGLPTATQSRGGLPTVTQSRGGLPTVTQSRGGLPTISQSSSGLSSVLQSRGGLPTVLQSSGGLSKISQSRGGFSTELQSGGGLSTVLQSGGGLSTVSQSGNSLPKVTHVIGGLSTESQVSQSSGSIPTDSKTFIGSSLMVSQLIDGSQTASQPNRGVPVTQTMSGTPTRSQSATNSVPTSPMEYYKPQPLPSNYNGKPTTMLSQRCLEKQDSCLNSKAIPSTKDIRQSEINMHDKLENVHAKDQCNSKRACKRLLYSTKEKDIKFEDRSQSSGNDKLTTGKKPLQHNKYSLKCKTSSHTAKEEFKPCDRDIQQRHGKFKKQKVECDRDGHKQTVLLAEEGMQQDGILERDGILEQDGILERGGILEQDGILERGGILEQGRHVMNANNIQSQQQMTVGELNVCDEEIENGSEYVKRQKVDFDKVQNQSALPESGTSQAQAKKCKDIEGSKPAHSLPLAMNDKPQDQQELHAHLMIPKLTLKTNHYECPTCRRGFHRIIDQMNHKCKGKSIVQPFNLNSAYSRLKMFKCLHCCDEFSTILEKKEHQCKGIGGKSINDNSSSEEDLPRRSKSGVRRKRGRSKLTKVVPQGCKRYKCHKCGEGFLRDAWMRAHVALCPVSLKNGTGPTSGQSPLEKGKEASAVLESSLQRNVTNPAPSSENRKEADAVSGNILQKNDANIVLPLKKRKRYSSVPEHSPQKKDSIPIMRPLDSAENLDEQQEMIEPIDNRLNTNKVPLDKENDTIQCKVCRTMFKKKWSLRRHLRKKRRCNAGYDVQDMVELAEKYGLSSEESVGNRNKGEDCESTPGIGPIGSTGSRNVSNNYSNRDDKSAHIVKDKEMESEPQSGSDPQACSKVASGTDTDESEVTNANLQCPFCDDSNRTFQSIDVLSVHAMYAHNKTLLKSSESYLSFGDAKPTISSPSSDSDDGEVDGAKGCDLLRGCSLCKDNKFVCISTKSYFNHLKRKHGLIAASASTISTKKESGMFHKSFEQLKSIATSASTVSSKELLGACHQSFEQMNNTAAGASSVSSKGQSGACHKSVEQLKSTAASTSSVSSQKNKACHKSLEQLKVTNRSVKSKSDTQTETKDDSSKGEYATQGIILHDEDLQRSGVSTRRSGPKLCDGKKESSLKSVQGTASSSGREEFASKKAKLISPVKRQEKGGKTIESAKEQTAILSGSSGDFVFENKTLLSSSDDGQSRGKDVENMKAQIDRGVYRCCHCSLKSSSYSGVQRHLMLSHNIRKPVMTNTTGVKNVSQAGSEKGDMYDKFILVQRNASPVYKSGKGFTCSVCERTFLYRMHVKSHMRKHPVHNKQCCLLCDFSARRRGNMINHLNSVHAGAISDGTGSHMLHIREGKDAKSKADVMLASENNAGSGTSHTIQASESMKREADVDDTSRPGSQTNVKIASETEPKTSVIMCEADATSKPSGSSVSKRMGRQNNVEYHKDTSTMDRELLNSITVTDGQYRCPYCKEMKAARNKERHISMHSNGEKKPYHCNHCDFQAAMSNTIHQHILLKHTKHLQNYKHYYMKKQKRKSQTAEAKFMYDATMRCFICSYCKAKLKTRNTCKMHLLQHTDEKPYQCKLCNFECRQAVSIKLHFARKHVDDLQLSERSDDNGQNQKEGKPMQPTLLTRRAEIQKELEVGKVYEANELVEKSNKKKLRSSANVPNKECHAVNKDEVRTQPKQTNEIHPTEVAKNRNTHLSFGKEGSKSEYLSQLKLTNAKDNKQAGQSTRACPPVPANMDEAKQQKRNCSPRAASSQYVQKRRKRKRKHTHKHPLFKKRAQHQKEAAESIKATSNGLLDRMCRVSTSTRFKFIQKQGTVAGYYYCCFCAMEFESSEKMETHSEMHAGEQIYSCVICDYTSVSASCTRIHVDLCHRDTLKNIPQVGHHTQDSVDIAASETPSKPISIAPVPIEYCFLLVKTERDKKSRPRRNTETGCFTCSICGLESENYRDVEEHTRKHTMEKVYHCLVCEYRCYQKKDMIAHVPNHFQEMSDPELSGEKQSSTDTDSMMPYPASKNLGSEIDRCSSDTDGTLQEIELFKEKRDMTCCEKDSTSAQTSHKNMKLRLKKLEIDTGENHVEKNISSSGDKSSPDTPHIRTHDSDIDTKPAASSVPNVEHSKSEDDSFADKGIFQRILSPQRSTPASIKPVIKQEVVDSDSTHDRTLHMNGGKSFQPGYAISANTHTGDNKKGSDEQSLPVEVSRDVSSHQIDNGSISIASKDNEIIVANIQTIPTIVPVTDESVTQDGIFGHNKSSLFHDKLGLAHLEPGLIQDKPGLVEDVQSKDQPINYSKSYRCVLCYQVFLTYPSALNHIMISHPGRKYPDIGFAGIYISNETYERGAKKGEMPNLLKEKQNLTRDSNSDFSHRSLCKRKLVDTNVQPDEKRTSPSKRMNKTFKFKSSPSRRRHVDSSLPHLKSRKQLKKSTGESRFSFKFRQSSDSNLAQQTKENQHVPVCKSPVLKKKNRAGKIETMKERLLSQLALEKKRFDDANNQFGNKQETLEDKSNFIFNPTRLEDHLCRKDAGKTSSKSKFTFKSLSSSVSKSHTLPQSALNSTHDGSGLLSPDIIGDNQCPALNSQQVCRSTDRQPNKSGASVSGDKILALPPSVSRQPTMGSSDTSPTKIGDLLLQTIQHAEDVGQDSESVHVQTKQSLSEATNSDVEMIQRAPYQISSQQNSDDQLPMESEENNNLNLPDTPLCDEGKVSQIPAEIFFTNAHISDTPSKQSSSSSSPGDTIAALKIRDIQNLPSSLLTPPPSANLENEHQNICDVLHHVDHIRELDKSVSAAVTVGQIQCAWSTQLSKGPGKRVSQIGKSAAIVKSTAEEPVQIDSDDSSSDGVLLIDIDWS